MHEAQALVLMGSSTSQKVSVKALVDSNATGVIDSFKENKRNMQEMKNKGFL